MVLLQNAFILQFDYLNMKTTSIMLCMTLTAGLIIGVFIVRLSTTSISPNGYGKEESEHDGNDESEHDE